MILLGKGVDGGWSAILETARGADKLRVIDTYAGFDRAHTIFAGLIGGAFLSMASHGADQLIVQRLLASESQKDARKALMESALPSSSSLLSPVHRLGLFDSTRGSRSRFQTPLPRCLSDALV